MKRLVAVISSLLVLPAFAEIAPQYITDEVIEYTDDGVMAIDDAVATDATENVAADDASDAQPAVASARSGSSVRVSASRANRATGNVRARTNGASRALAARTTTSAPTRTAATRATTATAPTAARSATPATVAARASIIQTDTVNTPLYTGRVTTRGSAVGARMPTVRVTSGTTTATATTDSAATTTDELNELAEMTDFCKAQYTACMDNFCNVLDDNQGRCSCSVNLKNYAKTEAALKQATEDLQDVAQRIKYIGLSAAEVETLFTQTAAELTMQSSSDSSQIKTDLDKIKDMIIDVKSGTATTTDTGLSFDLSGLLDFSIDSTGFDLSSFLGGGQSETITNQRGEQLYKTATARCKASVLNACKNQGVDINIVTNAYDLEIDKQCLLYERSLTDANDEMSSTVRNAKSVLQQARLLVAQQKNTYDLRGCVNALDACMQDDFVCGDNYDNCLDPSGKYIVNGEVVLGSLPGPSGGGVNTPASAGETASTTAEKYDGGLYTTWNYNSTATTPEGHENADTSAWTTGGTVADYVAKTVYTASNPDKNSDNMSQFLQYKIGYHDDAEDRNYGMCMSVLNKCQNVTYDNRGSDADYDPANSAVTEFLQRTMVQIKARQDQVLADFAEDCMSEVTQCLSQNNWDPDKNKGSDGKACTGDPDDGECTVATSNKIALSACKPLIYTCISVNSLDNDLELDDQGAQSWVLSFMQD